MSLLKYVLFSYYVDVVLFFVRTSLSTPSFSSLFHLTPTLFPSHSLSPILSPLSLPLRRHLSISLSLSLSLSLSHMSLSLLLFLSPPSLSLPTLPSLSLSLALSLPPSLLFLSPSQPPSLFLPRCPPFFSISTSSLLLFFTSLLLFLPLSPCLSSSFNIFLHVLIYPIILCHINLFKEFT